MLINYLLPFPALDIFVVTTLFPYFSRVTVVSVEGVVLNEIHLESFGDRKGGEPPAVTYCNESGYVLFAYDNVVTVWSISRLAVKEARPMRIIKGL